MTMHDLTLFLVQRLAGPYQIYTHVPATASCPYISLEILLFQQGQKKSKAILIIKAWSQSREASEIHNMAEHIRQQLVDQLLPVKGGVMGSCRVTDESTTTLNDRNTRVYSIKLLLGMRG